MYHVWDGTEWNSQKALKVWNGSAWVKTPKFKVRTSISWLPTSVSDTDISKIVKWSVGAPTPPPPPPPVTHPVPDLDLMDSAQLDAALTPLNFGYTIAGYEVTSVLANDNKVVINSQIPPAESLMAEGLDVSVKLYNFVQPTATVPNLNGLLKSAADTSIVNAGFVVGTPLNTVETYDTNLIGKVVADSQYPTAGSIEDTGTSIVYDYYIQKTYTTVPDLTGIDESDIYLTLDNAQLVVGTRTTVETTNTALEYTVKTQYPLPGTQAQVDSAVNYTVYIPNTTTTVPNLIGLTQSAADALLSANELYLGTVTNVETTNPALEGTVSVQQYATGTTRPINTTVNVTVLVPNTTIAVPNIVGINSFDADALLENTYELYLGLSGTAETTDTNLHLKIKSTNPVAGTVVPIWSTVLAEIWVPLTRPTPNIQLTYPQSYGTAAGDGYTWGSNTLASTNTTDANLVGKVATQNPIAGTSNSPQAINYGIYVDNRPTVPNVVGQAQSTAQSNISSAGLNYSVTTQTVANSSQNYLAGTVASQSPAGGTKVTAGSTVSIVVYTAYVAQPVTRYGTKTLFTGAVRSYTSAGTSLSTTYAYHGTFNSTTNTNCFGLVMVPYSFTEQSLNGFQITAARYYFYQDHTYSAGTPVNVYVGTHNQSSLPSSITRSSAIVTTGNVNTTVSRGDFTYVNLSATQRAAIWGGAAYGLSIYAPSSTATGSNYGYHTPNWVEVDYTWTEYV